MRSVSVVIPTYNGKPLLEKNLPPLLDAISQPGVDGEVIVVDDGSADGTVEFLRQSYPQVRVYRNETNRGFPETMNVGIFAAGNDIVMSLNNDVVVERDLFLKVLPRLDEEDVFVVSPNIIDPRNGRNQAIYILNPGICWFTDFSVELNQVDRSREIPIFFAQGGAAFYDRRKLWALGGFDRIYRPFYIEDVDLSYRAWKSGWKCLLEPDATVWHETNTTTGKYYRNRRLKFLIGRNKTIFMWANITDRKLVALYFLCLLPSLLWDVLHFRKYKVVGMFRALGRLGEIREARRKRAAESRRSDISVIARVSCRNRFSWLYRKSPDAGGAR